MLLKRALKFTLVLLAALSLYAMQMEEARAVITYQSAGAVSDSNVTSINPAYPAAVATGDLLILIIGMKPTGAAPSGSVATPEGWTLITSLVGAGGYGGVPAVDTGDINVFAYYKAAEGNETGSLRVRLTANNVAWSQMYRLTNATQNWSVAGTTGSDITAGAVSITMSANPGVTAGDFILGAMVIPTDVTTPTQFSAQAFTQTGVTAWGAVTEISEPDSTLGNDIGGFVVRSSVTTGTGTAAPVMTATAGGTTTNVRGPGVFIRVRATGAITYQSAGAIDYIAATLGTSVCAAHPAAVAAGDLLVTLIGMKPTVLSGGSVTTPSGWTTVSGGSLVGAGGYLAVPAADTGNTNVFSFYRVATGTEATERCFELTTNNVSWAQMYRFSSTTQAWQLAGTTGSDITAGSVSITMSANPGVTAGDHILGAMVIPTDVTTPAQFSVEAFSQTGVTFGAVTEISEPDSTTGLDIGGFVVRSSASAGAGSAAPVMTATAGGTTTNVRGPGVFIRIRDEPAFTQAAFRFYEDGTEAGSTVIAAQDTNITRDVAPGNSSLLLRLRLQETNGVNGLAADDYQIQYSKNGGAYTDITGVSTNVQAFASGNLTNGGASTNRLTAGSGTFVAGEVSTDGVVNDHLLTASNYTEYLYSLTLISADLANGDTLDFRVLRNGAVINTYSVTPRITASKVIPGSFNAVEVSTAVNGVIKTKVAGTGFNLDVVAISGGVQQAGFLGAVSVELLGNIAAGVAIDAQNCPTSSTLVQGPLSPDITGGRATVGFAAVPNAWRDVRVRVRWPISSPTVTWCSSDNFAIRPASLVSPAAADDDWASASATSARALGNIAASGGNVHKAGQPFRISATARNSSAVTTTNYNGAPTAISVTRVLPTVGECAGCAAGTLLTGAWSASASGVADTLDATYSEAGSISMILQDQTWADVDLSDGSTTGERYFSSAAFNVGRFVPDHFVVTTTGSTPTFQTFGVADGACQTPPVGNKRSFTYIGQPFGYTVVPVATFTGKNASGGTTFNYTASLIHTGSISAAQTYTPAAATLSATVGAPTIAAGTPAGSGTGTVTINSTDSFFYVRSTAAPQGAFNASIDLGVTVSDASEAGASQGTITTTSGATFPSILFDFGNLFRYGRLQLQNANGSQLISMPIPISAQYWNGTGFVTNTLDNCTTITASNIAIGNPQPVSFTVGAPTVGGAFTAGISTLRLPASGAGTRGSVDVSVNLTGGTAGASCTTTGMPASTGANLSYLQGAWWCEATYVKDPTARATFGVYKNTDRFIYQRENF